MNTLVLLLMSEFNALPVTGPDSLVKVAFHNGLADCDPATLVRDDLPGDLEKIKVIIAQSNIWG